MGTRVLGFGCALTIVCVLLGAAARAGEPEGGNARAASAVEVSSGDQAGPPVRGRPLVSDSGEPMGALYPMAAEVRRQGGVAGAVDPDAACRAEPGAVYCSVLSPGWWQPPGGNPNILVADDVSLAAVAGCELDRYVLKVHGDVDGLGSGPYAVDAALYASCPGAGGATPIPGTVCHKELLDEGPAVVVCEAPLGTVLPSNNLWMGLKFSRLHCALAVGAPATKGFSADLFDFPGFACTARFGGFDPTTPTWVDRHASFYLEVYARGKCADPNSDPPTEAFPNYKGSNHAGQSYTPGGGIRFADDISLSVPRCRLSRIEVAVKGNGVTTIDLRTHLSDADPVNGGVIPDTRFFVIGAPGLVIGHKDFDPPIQLTTPDLWVGYVTTSSVTGPIVTDRPADLGRNDNMILVHNGDRWSYGPLADGRYAVTDVTVHCAGSPPSGACCDMVFVDNITCVGGENHGKACSGGLDCPGGRCIGDSVCRDDLSEMNCPVGMWPHLWVQGGVCEGECAGGDHHGAACTRQIGCPGSSCVGGPDDGASCETDADCLDGGKCRRAECDGPFLNSCGLSACCTVEDECLNLTRKECFEQPPVDEPEKHMFQPGQYCDVDDQRCPFGVCLGRDGPCSFPMPHPEPGCCDPFCCTEVCKVDPSCCLVAWVDRCAELALELCWALEAPANDECSGPGEEGATLLRVPGWGIADVESATENASDPGLCCHQDNPGAPGVGTVWFKFVGPEPERTEDEFSWMVLSACRGESEEGRESLIQVFTVADPDRGTCLDGAACSISVQDCADGSQCIVEDEVACQDLVPVACRDGGDCLEYPMLYLPNVIPGQLYYVMVAARNEANRDLYSFGIARSRECTFGRLDGSWPIDMRDVAAFQRCFTGHGGLTDPACERADLDGCGDVDLDDFAVFYGLLGR